MFSVIWGPIIYRCIKLEVHRWHGSKDKVSGVEWKLTKSGGSGEEKEKKWDIGKYVQSALCICITIAVSNLIWRKTNHLIFSRPCGPSHLHGALICYHSSLDLVSLGIWTVWQSREGSLRKKDGMPLKGSASETLNNLNNRRLWMSRNHRILGEWIFYLHNDYYMQLLSASSIHNTSLRTLHVFM